MERRIMAVCGAKNSGKTTLIERLIPVFSRQGLQVAVIKHDGHCFIPDVPGTDTSRFWNAGAIGTAVFDGEKVSVVAKRPVSEKELFAAFPEADLILLEGFKYSPYPKIEVIRKEISNTPVSDQDTCVAYVSDGFCSTEKPVFHLNELEPIAACILKFSIKQRKGEVSS